MPHKNSQTATGAPLTTAQSLGTLIKSARDIMRKDKGLNGDLDRLPMLTWIMFLKFLDDSERLIGYSDTALCKADLTTATTDPSEPMRPGVDVKPKQPKRD
jgi:hypothetical protein